MVTCDFTPEQQLFKVEISLQFLKSKVQIESFLNVEGDTNSIDVLKMICDLIDFH